MREFEIIKECKSNIFLENRNLPITTDITTLLCEYNYCSNNIDSTYTIETGFGDFNCGLCDSCLSHIENLKIEGLTNSHWVNYFTTNLYTLKRVRYGKKKTSSKEKLQVIPTPTSGQASDSLREFADRLASMDTTDVFNNVLNTYLDRHREDSMLANSDTNPVDGRIVVGDTANQTSNTERLIVNTNQW